MTTITNFLQSNFIDSTEIKDAEINQNPIWILNADHQSSINQSAIKEYILNHCVQTNKPLIHLDLGISLIKKYPSLHFPNILLQNGLKVSQPVSGKSYFIIRTPISLRSQTHFLTKLISQINSLHQSQILQKLMSDSGLAKKYQGKYCLLVEGIEAMLLLNKGKEIQSFISQLSNLHQSVRQISIFAQQKLITKELMFSLQRISTCLTTLTAYNQLQGIWDCISTVRRYTGYSNEEPYTLTFNKTSQKIKVTKKLHIIDLNKETKQQQQMVKNLGFVVKRQQKDKQQSEQLKRMIYPHLKIIQDQQQQNTQTQNPDEGLIILDDEQEDEDDIDV